MSTLLRLELLHAPRAEMFDVPLADLCWVGEAPLDPLGDGRWELYRSQISTRITTVQLRGSTLDVTIRSGACREDVALALALVRRAAVFAEPMVDVDMFGPTPVDQLDVVMDDAWQRSQLASAARVTIALGREHGLIAMPGPTRDVHFGPRTVAELEGAPEAQRGATLVDIIRRVVWPPPHYEQAGLFETTSEDGAKLTVAMLLPNRACVLPRTDKLVVQGGDDVILIARASLRALPLEFTPLDDGNDLLEPVPSEAWPAVVQAARRARGG